MSLLITSRMCRPLFWASVLTIALGGIPLTAAHAAAASGNSNAGNFYVPLNRAELITTNSDISEVIIADPEVANVMAHGKRKISILGIAPGQTTLRVFDADHKLIRTAEVVVTYDLPAVRRALKEFLPNERIGVSVVNTRIALTGEVSSAAAASSAMEIAEEFVHGKLSQGEVEMRRAKDGQQILSPVINLMKINSGQQVMLRIRIGEVQRNAVRNLGISLQALGDRAGPNFMLGTGIGRLAPAVSGSTAAFSYGTINAGTDAFLNASIYSQGSNGIGAAIEALERDGLLKTLAEPTLTALSGEEAQFLAGGEFPIAVPQQQGTQTIQYKTYGVALKFVPYVLSKNRLRIQVQPEVSEISNENQLVVTGFVAPSIITRRASTTVELAPGESFMIAGLLRDNVTTTIDQLPGAGEIPVLGALFRSTAYQRKETELVIAVTPYLVDPIKDSDIKLPSDDMRPATFFESVFLGKVASNRGAKMSSPEGPTGFMTDN